MHQGGRAITDQDQDEAQFGSEFGRDTVDLVNTVMGEGVNHAVLLMRHSAREYAPEKHDLENPLTEAGRDYARRVGEALPKHLTLRGYASPPHRCMETAELVLSGHAAGGGPVTRHRPLEALGVFYVLDQMKMWRCLRESGGLPDFIQRWMEGDVPRDALLEPNLASRALLEVLAEKLNAPVAEAQLDVCVSHDMTLYLMRTCLLGQPADAREVRYLDGLLLYARGGELKLKGLEGGEVTVGAASD
jgi:hypothetical protein